MNTDKLTPRQLWIRVIFLTMVIPILIGSTIWSVFGWNNLLNSISSNGAQITVNLATFYCTSMIIISGCAAYILIYELIKKRSLPKSKMQTTIYILMAGIAVMVFLPRHAGRYFMEKAEQQGYEFNQEASYQFLIYRKLVFTKL